MRSAVFLAAVMPAILATAAASPLGRSPLKKRSVSSGDMVTKASATASRSVTSLPPTSTMWTSPDSLRWVSLGSSAIDPLPRRRPLEHLNRHRAPLGNGANATGNHCKRIGCCCRREHVGRLAARLRHSRHPLFQPFHEDSHENGLLRVGVE